MTRNEADLIAEAIRAGKVTRLAPGARALPERAERPSPAKVAPTSCGSGRQRPEPGADEQGW